MTTTRILRLSLGIVALLLLALPALAQGQTITDDQVDEVAEDMYCPVCENEPLDDCRTPTCMQWKEEIREQLGQGLTQQQIIDDFVVRYGQHVVGVPQDPVLRTLSFAAPILGLFVVLAVGALTFLRWQRGQRLGVEAVDGNGDDEKPKNKQDDPYRQQLERDLGL
jgi:cytochrome c-type biogenesis protein CcmH